MISALTTGTSPSLKATARLAKVHSSVVARLNRKVGLHAEAFHDERVHDLEVVALEADERHGYAHETRSPFPSSLVAALGSSP